MFRHVVIMRWTDSATAEQKQTVLDALATLPPAIPEIRGYRIGVDAGLEPERNSDLVIVADFDDLDGYLVYRDHPVHVEMIANVIRPLVAARAAVQHPLD